MGHEQKSAKIFDSYLDSGSSPVRLTVLAAKSEADTTVSQRLHMFQLASKITGTVETTCALIVSKILGLTTFIHLGIFPPGIVDLISSQIAAIIPMLR